MDEAFVIARPALAQIGDTSPWQGSKLLSGGMINRAYYLATQRAEYVLKASTSAQVNLFASEAAGLALLGSTHTIRVPSVYAHHDTPAPQTSYILLEWIAPQQGTRQAYEQLGRDLAALHHCTAPQFGLQHNNYLGLMPQRNQQHADWSHFFAQQRLAVQAEIAQQQGYLPLERARRLHRLIEQIDRFLGGHAPPASLTHGDLWAGNLLFDAERNPVLIDPAVWYADREVELAYMSLFHGFPDVVEQSYCEQWPLPAGWQERRPLYQLYHLLNHLNHFGEQYGTQVDFVLQHYC